MAGLQNKWNHKFAVKYRKFAVKNCAPVLVGGSTQIEKSPHIAYGALCVHATEHNIADSVRVVRRLDFIDSFAVDVAWTPPLYRHI
jgi:hypothetical protein